MFAGKRRFINIYFHPSIKKIKKITDWKKKFLNFVPNKNELNNNLLTVNILSYLSNVSVKEKLTEKTFEVGDDVGRACEIYIIITYIYRFKILSSSNLSSPILYILASIYI